MGANLQQANLGSANLQQTYFGEANLQQADLREANLQQANLQEAFFDAGTRLRDVVLGNGKSGSVSVADLNWGGVNLAVVDWTAVKVLGDEYVARQSKTSDEEMMPKTLRMIYYRTAVRANRQLAVALRDQGLNEESDYFAYRAQRLQRTVLWRQGLLSNKEVDLKISYWNKEVDPKITFWQRVRKLSAFAFSGFLDVLAGYGYRPARTLFWYLFVITAFTTAYAVFGHLPPLPDALVFSFMSFHGRGFFPSLNGETNLHNPLVVLAAAEAVTGLFIEISFIATFTQRFFGR